jgi:hypothetical protein
MRLDNATLKSMATAGNYSWVKIKHYPLKHEPNYEGLLSHHIEETSFLIETIRALASEILKQRAQPEGLD